MTWEVYRESAVYWDVGKRMPAGAVDVDVGDGLRAFEPVCRVKKHANGSANLALILGLPVEEEKFRKAEGNMRDHVEIEMSTGQCVQVVACRPGIGDGCLIGYVIAFCGAWDAYRRTPTGDLKTCGKAMSREKAIQAVRRKTHDLR